MAYLFRQKLNISELANVQSGTKRILIYEPEQYLGALYARYLKPDNFDVQHCFDLNQLSQAVWHFQPRLLIFSADPMGNWPKLRPVLTLITRTFPELGVISTGYNLSNDQLAQLMAIGLSGHINRRLSRPQDVAVVVQNILK